MSNFFLLSCSRRVFGVIEERCICIVLDVNTTSESEFGTYLHGLVQVLKEQVMFIAKFNLVRYIIYIVTSSYHYRHHHHHQTFYLNLIFTDNIYLCML